MVWITPVVVLGVFTLLFPGVGFIWGFCFGFIFLLVCWEMLGVTLFFTLINSWVLVDHFSMLMEILVVVVFIISLSCSVKDFKVCGSSSFKGLDTAVAMVSVFCFLFFIQGSWMSFYFFFEATLIPTLWLILKWGYQPERLQAGMVMLLYTGGASVPLLITLVYMQEVCGSDSFILAKLACMPLLKVPVWVWGFSLLGFLVKVPIYGFHVWLPKAHVEAPLSGSMLLAGVLLKLGGFGLIRLMWSLSMFMNDFFLFIVSLSLWGGVLSSLVAMMQSDIKSMIAYSSVGHMSLVVAGLMSCYPLGKLSAECMMFAHGVCSPCMFALAASSYDLSHSRNISLNKSVLQVFPVFCFFWFVFNIINMGCPPSLNYFAEVISFSAIKNISVVFAIPMALMCQFSCVYSVFLFGYVSHGSLSSALQSKKGSLSERYSSSFLFSALFLFLGFFVLDFFL